MLASSSTTVEDIDKFIFLTSIHVEEESGVIPIFEELKNRIKKKKK